MLLVILTLIGIGVYFGVFYNRAPKKKGFVTTVVNIVDGVGYYLKKLEPIVTFFKALFFFI